MTFGMIVYPKGAGPTTGDLVPRVGESEQKKMIKFKLGISNHLGTTQPVGLI